MDHIPDIRLRGEATRKGKFLEYVTIGWNLIEGGMSVGLGAYAGSIALVAFGIDSFLELSSGAVLLWRLRRERDDDIRLRSEEEALRIVGIIFLGLCAYVAFGAVKALVSRQSPEKSPLGIALAAAALVVMPLLAREKRKVGAALHSRAMRADARQSDLCAILAAILLGGLVLYYALGWWWADPAAGILMVPVIAKEAIEALRGETPCCDRD